MNRRNILSAVLGAVIAGLVAVIVFLGGCAAPDTEATDPAPATPVPQANAPHSAPAVRPGHVVVRSGGSGGGGTARTPRTRHRTHPQTHPSTHPSTHTTPVDPPAPSEPARLGKASVPAGATYDATADRQAFTTVFSTLEAGTGKALSKRLSTTLTITGDTDDAVLELAVSGYAITDASTNAKVTVTANRRTVKRAFRSEWDDEFVQTLSVPLRGAHQCTVTLTVEVQPNPAVRAAGYIDILALDGQFI